MKFRGLLIAVVVLLALGGLLYWSNRHKPSAEGTIAASGTSPSILKLDQSSISALTLTHNGDSAIHIEKSDAGNWQISAPKACRADQDAVSGMLSTISNLSADRVVEDKPSDLKPFGLDAPSLTLDIALKDHKDRKLLIGDNTPAGGNLYVKLEDDPRVFTIAAYSKTSFDKSLNDLRDKRLLTVVPDKVSRIVLNKKPETIEFARVKDGWQILKPNPARADSFAVDEFARTVADARMDLGSGSDDDAAKAFASAAPVASVTLTGDQGPQTLEIRKSKDDYYARSSAIAGTYKVDASLGTAFGKNVDDYRNKKLFDFGFDEPDKIEMHQGSTSWFFTHSGSDWWSNGKKMDATAAEGLVGSLRELSASSFPASGFTNTDLEIVVTSGGGKRVERVAISKSASSCFAKREGEPDLYQVGATAVTDLVKAANAVKPAAPAAKGI